MIDINLQPETIYDWINRGLSQQGFNERLNMGYAIWSNKYVQKWTQKPVLNRDSWYLIVKAEAGTKVQDMIYDTRKHMNTIIGWGSDQLHLDEKDISATAKSETKDWYFFELKKRPWSSVS